MGYFLLKAALSGIIIAIASKVHAEMARLALTRAVSLVRRRA